LRKSPGGRPSVIALWCADFGRLANANGVQAACMQAPGSTFLALTDVAHPPCEACRKSSCPLHKLTDVMGCGASVLERAAGHGPVHNVERQSPPPPRSQLPADARVLKAQATLQQVRAFHLSARAALTTKQQHTQHTAWPAPTQGRVEEALHELDDVIRMHPSCLRGAAPCMLDGVAIAWRAHNTSTSIHSAPTALHCTALPPVQLGWREAVSG
jgi:hypothetical protein